MLPQSVYSSCRTKSRSLPIMIPSPLQKEMLYPLLSTYVPRKYSALQNKTTLLITRMLHPKFSVPHQVAREMGYERGRIQLPQHPAVSFSSRSKGPSQRRLHIRNKIFVIVAHGKGIEAVRMIFVYLSQPVATIKYTPTSVCIIHTYTVW